MKILVTAIGRLNAQNRDGGEIRFDEICKRWIKKGTNVHIILPKIELNVMKNAGLDATYHVLSDFLESYEENENRSRSNIWVLLVYLKRIVQSSLYKISNDFDIIYSPSDFLHDLIPAVYVKKRNKKSKLVVCLFLIAPNPFKGYINVFRKEYVLPTFMSLLYFVTQRFSMLLMRKYADLILVLNDHDKQFLEKYGIQPQKVKVVDMGVDLENISKIRPIALKKYDACFLGRLHPQKGIFDLIEIWKYVCQKRNNARLAIVGGGVKKDFNLLKKEIRKYNLQDNIDILGFQKGEDKYKTLKSSKCFVFPSTYESRGLVALEAMASGLPVIAYDLPVYKKIYTNGMKTVPIGNTKKFAETLLIILENDKLYKKLKNEALMMASKYNWDIIAKRDLEEIENLIIIRKSF